MRQRRSSGVNSKGAEKAHFGIIREIDEPHLSAAGEVGGHTGSILIPGAMRFCKFCKPLEPMGCWPQFAGRVQLQKEAPQLNDI